MSENPNTPPAIEFKDFGKITRYRTLEALVTEKVDGANAQIYVPEDPSAPVLAGSRNRWVTPDMPDGGNFGFGRFVAANENALRKLGTGRHYGEWYGAGIQRRYGLDHKRLVLFNVDRFSGGLPSDLDYLGPCIGLVPVLYRGPLDSAAIAEVTEKLYREGSVAVPGWTKPEGVIVQFAGLRFKITDNGDQHKGCTTEHAKVVQEEAAKDRSKKEATPFDVALRSIKVSKNPDDPDVFSVGGYTDLNEYVGVSCSKDEIPDARRQVAKQIVAANELEAA